ncbi:hypothetical protein BZL29_7883 [Mycobacterium kansasii]|uniref:Uncharacterized protein n=1 Tax=Mycobacterium kansasii TaxID=1768 RepID=A0A1V3WEA4_MYCKA|nr:hypothetical protein BZL29_7883 [Mycobacterium kansasii]
MTEPGVLPSHVAVETRIQAPWCIGVSELEEEFERGQELVWLAQECPQLAAAGTLTFGYGHAKLLDAKSAAAAVNSPKRPFGLWHVTLPPSHSLRVPEMLPPPHPQMRLDAAAQAWVTTEDLDGLAKDIRDGGAELTADQLSIDEAIVWPQQGRLLEAWATRLREAREAFTDDPALRVLVEQVAAEYLDALANAQLWVDPRWRHHFQPAWAAAIAARVRLRARRAAMRISREYRLWPVYASGAAMIYVPGLDEATNELIDLSDTHSRLGRMTVTRRASVTDETILAVLMAENTADAAAVLTAALAAPSDPGVVNAVPKTQATSGDPGIEVPPDRVDQHRDDASSARQASQTADEAAPPALPAPVALLGRYCFGRHASRGVRHRRTLAARWHPRRIRHTARPRRPSRRACVQPQSRLPTHCEIH